MGGRFPILYVRATSPITPVVFIIVEVSRGRTY